MKQIKAVKFSLTCKIFLSMHIVFSITNRQDAPELLFAIILMVFTQNEIC